MRLGKLPILALLSVVMATGLVADALGWDLPAAEMRQVLAAVKAEHYAGAASVVVFDRQDVTVEDNGLSRVVQHTLTKALDATGARALSARMLAYDPLSAEVELLRCRVFTAGAVREIDPKTVQDNPDPQDLIFWNARHKLVPVGRLEPGDAVELVTRRMGFTYALLDGPQGAEARFVPPMAGHFYDIVPFWSDRPVLEQSYRVTLPAAKALQYQFFNGGAEVSDRVKNGLRTLSITTRAYKPATREPGMVDWSDVAPKLLLTTAPDWKAKAVWFHGVQEKAECFAVSPELQQIANQVTAGLATEEDKAAALTHWVAENIRYVGLHMGKGEGFTLHPAAMTLRDRGGVCKDKAGILVALLRAAGLEAYAGMTMAGERIENLAADQFNHCITVWRRASDKKAILLDPTWVPGVRELWSSREQQQEVLMGLPEGADILTTPIAPPQDHPLDMTLQATLRPDGTLTGKLKIRADGQSDAGLRRFYRNTPRRAWAAFEQNLLASFDPRAELQVHTHTDPDDLGTPFALEADLMIPGYARLLTDGSLLLVPFSARHPLGVATRAEELNLSLTPKERAFPVRIGCSKHVHLEERLALPAGTKLQGLPADVKLEGPGALQASWKQVGNELRIDETLTLDRRIFTPAEWPSLRTALEAFRKLAETPLLLTVSKESK